MNLSITTTGQTAVAGQRPDFLANAGVGAALDHDARTQPRQAAALAAMVRTEDGERLGCIRNLSRRGVMLSMATPPRRGEFVEILAGKQSLIGQVRWASGARAGIALRNAIDVNSILSGKIGPVAVKPMPVSRAGSASAAAHIYPNSHIIARQLQFAAMIALGVCAALVIAFCVNDLLADVVGQIKAGLPG